MSYRLVKNQLGGGSFEILMLIVAVAVVYYLFVQSQRPVKEKYKRSLVAKIRPKSARYGRPRWPHLAPPKSLVRLRPPRRI